VMTMPKGDCICSGAWCTRNPVELQTHLRD
jgi:hypothetical protein